MILLRPFWLVAQFYDGDCFATMVFGFELGALDEGVGFQEGTEALSQGTRPVAVNDADSGTLGKGGFVEEFGHAFASLFDGHADHVDFVSAWIFASGGRDRDIFSRCGRNRDFAEGYSFDAGDFVKGYFHAQRSGFDFSGGAFHASQNHRFAESSYTDFCAGLQRFRVHPFRRLRFYAQIFLRIVDGLNDGGVQFVFRFSAHILHFAAGRFFELRAQRAVLYRFNDVRNVLVETLLHFGEFLLKVSDALLLTVDPFGTKRLAFLFEFLALVSH